MTVPVPPFATWIWAGLDPVLVLVALYLGWKADQIGKIAIAAIAALGIALVIDALLGFLGVPSISPLTRDGPTLLPVRSVAAVIWAAIGYAARRFIRR